MDAGWIVVFLIIFMLHNLEEIVMIERWFKKIYPRIRERIPSFAQNLINQFENITALQFAFVVFLVSIGASVLILIAVLTQHDFLFLALNIIFGLNIFTHPLQSLYLRCYTPGLWTSLLLIIPHNILFYFHFSQTGIFTLSTILNSLIVILIFIPVFILCHKAGQNWS